MKSFILSWICPGLGQFRNGRTTKGIIFLFGAIALYVLSGFILSTFALLMVFIVVALIFTFYSLFDAYKDSKNRISRKYQQVWFYIAIIAVWAVIFTFAKNSRRYSAYMNPSGSMLPTLYPGDRFYADSKAFKDRLPSRGDLVLYNSDGTIFVKRVVALPGDTLTIQDRVVTINGQKVPKTAMAGATEALTRENLMLPAQPHPQFFKENINGKEYTVIENGPETFPVPAEAKLKSDEIFVVGDNRDNSNDSRFTGPISKAQLIGRPLFIWFSKAPLGSVRWSRIGESLE
jgi:signal peptidase I